MVPIEELLPDDESRDVEQVLRGILDSYASTLQGDRRHLLDGYRFRHLARKVVGVGSVGTRAWIALLTGRDDQDPLFLQCKEAEASVLEPYLGASQFDNHGQRVVEGPAADAGRERHPARLAAGGRSRRWPRARLLRAPALGLEGLGRHRDALPAGGLAIYGPHVRLDAGSRPRPFPATRSRSGPTWAPAMPSTTAIAEFSQLYADQNERDHAALVDRDRRQAHRRRGVLAWHARRAPALPA